MDNPACTSSGSIPPPPPYSVIHDFPLCEEIPASPPPLYTPSIAPPAYGEICNVQEIPQNPNRQMANPYPILNVPPQILRHSEQVIVQQTVMPVAPQVIMVQPQQRVVVLGDAPTATVCKYCHKSIITNVHYRPGSAAWAMCCLLTLLGLICGFCLIPFFVRGLQDVHHSCPYCHRHLGIHIRK